MSARYPVPAANAWTEVDRWTVANWDEITGTIVISVAHARDTKTGELHHGGYRMVTVLSPTGRAVRSKKFVGETAWSAADNFARAEESKLRRDGAA